MELFCIDGKDFTTRITVPTYAVNRTDVFEEWVDANHITHRDRTRGRIEGTFTLLFSDKKDFFDFIDTVNRCKDPGGCYIAPVSLYVNNENIVEHDLQVFIEMELANSLPIMNIGENEGFEVTVTQR